MSCEDAGARQFCTTDLTRVRSGERGLPCVRYVQRGGLPPRRQPHKVRTVSATWQLCSTICDTSTHTVQPSARRPQMPAHPQHTACKAFVRGRAVALPTLQRTRAQVPRAMEATALPCAPSQARPTLTGCAVHPMATLRPPAFPKKECRVAPRPYAHRAAIANTILVSG